MEQGHTSSWPEEPNLSWFDRCCHRHSSTPRMHWQLVLWVHLRYRQLLLLQRNDVRSKRLQSRLSRDDDQKRWLRRQRDLWSSSILHDLCLRRLQWTINRANQLLLFKIAIKSAVEEVNQGITYINSLVNIQIRVHVSLMGAPNCACHRWPWLLESQNTFNVIPMNLFARNRIDNRRLDTEKGKWGRTWFRWGDSTKRCNDMRAGFCLPVCLWSHFD